MGESVRNDLALPKLGVHPDELIELRYRERLRTTDPIPGVSRVVDELRHAYEANDMSALAKQLGDLIPLIHDRSSSGVPVIVALDGQRLDVIVGEGQEDVAVVVSSLRQLAEDEFEVEVLVPLAWLGDAHAACHASGIQSLRAYWFSGETVVFGQPESP